MVVSDIYNDIKDVFSECSQEDILRKLGRAVSILSSKCLGWDPNLAEMTVCAHNNVVTLPYDVETPLAVAVNGIPSMARDKNFIYHINGTGPCSKYWQTPAFWDDAGEAPILRDLPHVCRLMAAPESTSDNGKTFIVYGTDANDRELITIAPDGTSTPGLVLPMNALPPVASPQLVKRISRVLKAETNQFVKFYAFSSLTNERMELGDYQPLETQPNYRRIRVQCKSSVRFRYRRRLRKFTNMNDFIPLNSEQAVILACRAVKAYELLMLPQAVEYETTAARLLDEEQSNRNAQSGIGVQIDNFTTAGNETLYGGVWGSGGYYG